MNSSNNKISPGLVIKAGMLFIIVGLVYSAAMSLPSHDENKPFRKSLEGRWKIHIGDDKSYSDTDYGDTDWDDINLPSNMLGYAMRKTGSITGILWIRKKIYIDKDLPKHELGLILGQIANADETYFNGIRINGTGSFPPDELSMWHHPRYYTIPASLIQYGKENVIAVRIWYYMLCGVNGTLAVTDTVQWQKNKIDDNFTLITLNYIIIAAGLPIFFIFFIFYLRRRASQEYLFYWLQLLCGLFVILELCNYWNTFGSILMRFKVLGGSWAALNVMHPIFLHRIYDFKRKLIEILLWIYLAVVFFIMLLFTNTEWLQIHGILMISITMVIGFYNLSCNIYALYKKNPYAKMFSFFGGAVVITAIHDGGLYLLKFMGMNVQFGFLFKHMLFPYGAALLYIGTSLILVSRFITMTDEIQDMNVNLEKKVDQRTQELEEANKKIWGEMELAKKIQTVLLPENPIIPGYSLSAYMQPAKEVGGDYYDVINAEGRDWIIIGDVSGHGVPAGLIMMMVQTSIHTVVKRFPNIRPSELISILNMVLRYNIRQMGEDKYMTLTAFAVSMDGKLYFSGLHQDIIIYRAHNGTIESIETEGMFLGIRDDIKDMLTDSKLKLNPGDCMLLYTDGITEAWKKETTMGERSPEQDMYGRERLRKILKSLGKNSTDEIKNGILKSLSDYECRDDVTLMVVKRLQIDAA